MKDYNSTFHPERNDISWFEKLEMKHYDTRIHPEENEFLWNDLGQDTESFVQRVVQVSGTIQIQSLVMFIQKLLLAKHAVIIGAITVNDEIAYSARQTGNKENPFAIQDGYAYAARYVLRSHSNRYYGKNLYMGVVEFGAEEFEDVTKAAAAILSHLKHQPGDVSVCFSHSTDHVALCRSLNL